MPRFFKQKGRALADPAKRMSLYVPQDRVWMIDRINDFVFKIENEKQIPYSQSKFLLDMVELGLQTFAENPESKDIIT